MTPDRPAASMRAQDREAAMTHALAAATTFATTLALALPSPAPAEEGAAWRNAALGLAAVAALAYALHERGEDEAREAATLPGACLRPVPTEAGPVGLYDPACLDDRFDGASRLPLGCAATVRSEGTFVSGFAPDCLAAEGFRAGRD